MRIGIDFDNTIVCYDEVFCDVAKRWKLVDQNYQGNKHQLRDAIWASSEGDLAWQRLQGKVYGEFMPNAKLFTGCKDFLIFCHAHPEIQVYIVSHKSEYGHYDEKRINLRDAARQWLSDNGLLKLIPAENIFFETTREEKIARIHALHCTHFIDDLIEVLGSPLFPPTVQRFLFQPQVSNERYDGIKQYSNWIEIKNEFFPHHTT
ncbi:MAG: hypothetical protein EPO11_01765 [Gammaproteobacteria bacterium]|nr:MAG: hypothetical protein EPO11_01765 [Gammaproteobacteria bacterium]